MTRAEKQAYLLSHTHHPSDINERQQLIKYLLDDLGEKELDIESIVNDLNAHRPIQYISNVAHFYGHKFYVDERVLIPRPETEELVYEVIKSLQKSKHKTILDIGTGSGIIPITTKIEYPDAIVSAVDVSEDALQVARINADNHKVDLHLMNIDILDIDACTTLQTYDIIVSNPPYIPNKERELMSANVLDHEPEIALFVEDSGPLLFYRRITQLAKSHLNENGILLFEINEYFADEMTEMVRLEGGQSQIIKDLQGKDRMMKIII